MPFDWRFRNFKRDPQPFLNGAVIDAENARNNLVQNAGNSMEGYTPLESTLAAQAMEGYKPVIPATQGQLAAGASQAMQGYTPNSVGRPSVPNDMHGGNAQPDLDGYGAKFEADIEEKAKQEKIADIQSQIKALQTRIAEKQAKLKNWNGDDVANKVAALEARKFFNQDPTSIWRWNVGQKQAKQLHDETLAAQKQQQEAAIKRAELEKSTQEQKTKDAILNEVTNTLPTMTLGMETTPDQRQQYLNTLAGLKTKAQNAGVPIEMITNKEKELAGELPSIRLQNSYTNFENMSNLFDKKANAGGYANNLKAYKEAIWNEWMAHPEFQNIPAYRQAMIKAMNAHNPVQKKPGTKPSKRK